MTVEAQIQFERDARNHMHAMASDLLGNFALEKAHAQNLAREVERLHRENAALKAEIEALKPKPRKAKHGKRKH